MGLNLLALKNLIIFSDKPIAFSVLLGSILPEEHADPVLTSNPSISNAIKILLDVIPGIQNIKVLGNLLLFFPIIIISLFSFKSSFSKNF